MQVTAIQSKPAISYAPAEISAKLSRPAKPAQRRISWEEFQKKYLSREDEFKYEWVDGMVEKTRRTMDQHQYQILRNLRQLFDGLKNQGKATGGFEPEVDTFYLPKKHRRPDISYFTEEQEDKMAFGENQVPRFLVEVISTYDGANLVNKKMKNYRAAGVEVVWKIFPETEEVHVCRGKNLTEVKICFGEDVCSAAPVLPDFALSVNDIFKLPVKK